MSKLFISHSSRNNVEAVAIREWLRAEGWDDVFLDTDPARGIGAGERWREALNRAAHRCEAVLILVSRAWLASAECRRELAFADKLNKALVCALIEDVPLAEVPALATGTWQVVDLASGRDHGLHEVVVPQTLDRQAVTFSKDGLARLKAGLLKAGLDPSFFAWPPAGDPKRPPYPGLRPLEREDAGIFFGREAQTIEALDRLRALRDAAGSRLLCLLGASGSGKSSFLRAGLWPRLARDDRSFLPLPVLRPERAAISGTAGLVWVLDQACEAQGIATSRAAIREAVAGGAETLRPVLRRIVEVAAALLVEDGPGDPPPAGGGGRREAPDGGGAPGGVGPTPVGFADSPSPAGEGSGRRMGGERVAPVAEVPKAPPPLLVLPIDQGEELFLAEGAEEAATLLTLLRDLLGQDEPALAVVMTIRSDAFERLQLAPQLAASGETAAATPQTLAFGPMPRGVFATIIEGPAARMRDAGRPLAVEPALTRALLDDMEAGGGRDALPLLAFTLERLWLDYGGAGRLAFADYEALGRVRGSIEAAVEEVLRTEDARIPRDRAARLALLRRGLVPWLAGIDPETGSPRRRVARRREIPAEAVPLIDLLVEARLLSADTDDVTGEATIEPAHEALLRQWGLLEGWLEEDAGRLAALEGVRRATRDWAANARNAAWLAHGGDRLAEAEALSDRPDLSAQLDAPERDYLAACRARARDEAVRAEREAETERRSEQRRRLLQRGSIAAALVFACLLVVAGFQWRDAAAQRGESDRQAAIAREREREAAEQRDAARRNFDIARSTIERVVQDLARGLRDVEGIRVSVLRLVLSRVETAVDRLTAAAPDDPALQLTRSIMLDEFGDTYLRAGDRLAALKAFEEALEIDRRLAARESENADRQRSLAIGLTKLGDVKVLAGDLAGALASYEEGLAIGRRLVAQDPSSAQAARDLSVSLERVGDVQVARGDLAGALASYEEGLAIGRRRATRRGWPSAAASSRRTRPAPRPPATSRSA